MFRRRVCVSEEPEIALVVPADERHVALHHDTGLASGLGPVCVDEHRLGQPGAVALLGA